MIILLRNGELLYSENICNLKLFAKHLINIKIYEKTNEREKIQIFTKKKNPTKWDRNQNDAIL